MTTNKRLAPPMERDTSARSRLTGASYRHRRREERGRQTIRKRGMRRSTLGIESNYCLFSAPIKTQALSRISNLTASDKYNYDIVWSPLLFFFHLLLARDWVIKNNGAGLFENNLPLVQGLIKFFFLTDVQHTIYNDFLMLSQKGEIYRSFR